MDLEKRREILLLILNKILTNINKPIITTISEFMIDRDDLVLGTNEKLMESNYELIFTCYNKEPSHYRRAAAKNYIVILLKTMCAQVGLKLDNKKSDIGITIKERKYRKKQIMYFIN